MGGKSGGESVVVGYWYAVGMHMVLCSGPVDEFVRIIVGDRLAWSGSTTTNAQLRINKPNLFGGESREGGIDGWVDIMLGGQAQPCNDYLVAKVGGGPPVSDPNSPPLANGYYVGSDGKVYLPDGTPLTGYTMPTGSPGGTPGLYGFIPAFRGVLSVVLRQVWVAAMNPYIKPWSFMVRRYPGALGAMYAKIGTDANPAAIIAECLLNSDWGLGYPASALDINSFNAAAVQLASENFGLSLTWSKQKSVDEFISHVLSTVDGYRYSDPTNGKIGIRLARNDYDPNTLVVLDDTNIESISQFVRPDPSDIINMVTVTFVERPSWAEKDADGNPTGETIVKNVDRSITVHNGASIDLVGQTNSSTVEYPGISNVALASRVAMRELAARSRGLASIKLVVNRTAAQLKAGDVFKLNWPPLNIVGLVARITEIDYGLLTDGRITVTAIEDSFSLPSETYIGKTGSAWRDPIEPVQPITASLLFEVPYYVAARSAQDNDTSLATLPDGWAFLGVVAQRAQSQATSVSVWQNSSGGYVKDTTGGYTPCGTLDGMIDDAVTSFDVSWLDLTGFAPDSFAFLGSEVVWITGLNGKTLTVLRGVLDTVPAPHAAGDMLWLAGSAMVADKTSVFLANQTVGVKLQPRTSSQELPLASAVASNITFVGRGQKPYPPGNIRINGVYRPASVTGSALTFSWASRNRLTQTAGPVAQTAADITPEANTTYTVQLFQRADVFQPWQSVGTVTGIATTSYTWAGTMPTSKYLRAEIWSVRTDGAVSYPSYQKQAVVFEWVGYGIGYGNNYGNYYGGF